MKTKQKARINLTKKLTPIAKGVLNGVEWCSLTTMQSIRCSEIKKTTFDANRKLKAFGVNKKLSHAQAIDLHYNMTVSEFINREFERLKYYKSFAKYKNNLQHG